MKKNRMALVAFSLFALGIVGLVGVSGSYAQEPADNAPQLLERVAGKLALPTEKLEKAFSDVRGEVHEERLAEALASGSLTQEQVALLDRIHDYRVSTLGEPGQHRMTMHEELKDLSFEERKAHMEAFHEEQITSLAKALDISVEDIEAVQEAAREAGLGKMGMNGPGGGRGKMGGMLMGMRHR